jgi:hypothetical protein
MSDSEKEDEEQVQRPTATIRLHAHVNGEEGEKIIPIPCGTGPQTIKWLGHVGIARYDEEEYQGWVKLGIPTNVRDKDGQTLDLNTTIVDSGLKNEDHVYIESSMFQVSEGKQSDSGNKK